MTVRGKDFLDLWIGRNVLPTSAEAGDDEKLTSAACDRDFERTDKLFERLQKMKPVSDDDIQELVRLADTLLEFSWDNARRIKVILRMASNALTDRRVKQAA